MHCAKCLNFIGSCIFDKSIIIDIEQIPNTLYFIVIRHSSIELYKACDNLKLIYVDYYDDNEIATSMCFITDNLILVGTKSGKGIIYAIHLASSSNQKTVQYGFSISSGNDQKSTIDTIPPDSKQNEIDNQSTISNRSSQSFHISSESIPIQNSFNQNHKINQNLASNINQKQNNY